MPTRLPLQGLLLVLVLVFGAGCGEVSESDMAPGSDATMSASVKPLVFTTYNVLADRVAAAERMKSLFEIINRDQPDVIALQEVVPWFLDALMEQPWVQEHYYWPSFEGELRSPGGQMILSRHPILKATWTILSGKQRRTAMVVYLEVSGQEIVVATTHMESPLEDGPARAKQLDEIFALVADADHAVVLGDFNFGDGEAEESQIPPDYVDLWMALHPNDSGYTWNIEMSEMARMGSFAGETSRRIDRILLRSSAYQPSWIKIVGDEPLVPDRTVFPSDHFGLVGAISLRPDHSTN